MNQSPLEVRDLPPFPDVRCLRPVVHQDERGFFVELFSVKAFAGLGLPTRFVQDNYSVSHRAVLRGLHFQHPSGQGKLVMATRGEILDVVVDIRLGSPTFGLWSSVRLSADNRQALYVPEGFAHGFVVLGEQAEVMYKCTSEYKPDHEHCLFWNDHDVAISWPFQHPVVSSKDAQGLSLKELSARQFLPVYDPKTSGFSEDPV